MSPTLQDIVAATHQLSLEDRLTLMDQLWETLAPCENVASGLQTNELSDSDRALIEERRLELQTNPGLALSDKEVRQRLTQLWNG